MSVSIFAGDCCFGGSGGGRRIALPISGGGVAASLPLPAADGNGDDGGVGSGDFLPIRFGSIGGIPAAAGDPSKPPVVSPIGPGDW